MLKVADPWPRQTGLETENVSVDCFVAVGLEARMGLCIDQSENNCQLHELG